MTKTETCPCCHQPAARTWRRRGCRTVHCCDKAYMRLLRTGTWRLSKKEERLEKGRMLRRKHDAGVTKQALAYRHRIDRRTVQRLIALAVETDG